MSSYPYAAKRRVIALINSLETILARDPEQEVTGIALPVVDATIAEIKAARPNDAVVRAMADVISVDLIASNEPVRAADMLVAVRQLDAAIGPKRNPAC